MPRRVKESVFTGLGVSPGIAIGPAHVHESGAAAVPEYEIPVTAIETERERFADAVAHATRQVGKLRSKAAELPANAAEELGYLLDAYQQMLGSSRLVRGVDARIARQRVNAEAAVQAEIAEIAASFAEMQDSYLAARGADIREVGTRLIRSLTKTPYQAFSKLPPDAIIVAEDLSPADTALMDPDTVAGFATVLGGAEGHTAIMARSLGLPAVLGVPELLLKVRTGDLLVVDGGVGKVIVNPTAATLERYRAKQASREQETKALGRLRKVPAVTRDGVQITLQANLEFPRDLKQAIGVGAEGIGLLRSEFLFMNRNDLPKEEEQFEALRELVEGMEGHPVTVRTLDIGGDKLANTLDIKLADSPNPALGLRAIRLSLR
ncbi:MAG: phosphoenolpyruvate--protein phosphotransferase, partial [Alphaproteobacteria bacterium]